MIGKVLIGIGVLILLFLVAAVFSFISNQNEPPPKIVSNFVDLDKIEKISKYRSCAGHVTIPQDNRETKRNMKHYFAAKAEFVKTDAVKIYAPYNGYVTSIRSDPGEGLEGEIWIVPKRKFPILPPFGVWQFSVQHIIVKDGLKMGSEVKAGEVIGHSAASDVTRMNVDIVYGKMALGPKNIDNWNSPFTDLDSVFNHMSDEVLAQYQQRGLIKEKLLISKEERDNKPCQYKDGGPYFQNHDDPDNWVVLQ